MENVFTIDGVICIEPKTVISPSGIPHCTWSIQHQSERMEAGIRRKVWLRLNVAVSGSDLVAQVKDYRIGTAVRCTGFMTSHKTKKIDFSTVLHAQQVEVVVLEDKETNK